MSNDNLNIYMPAPPLPIPRSEDFSQRFALKSTEVELSHRLTALETRLPYFKEDLDSLYNKIDALDKSYQGIDKKLEVLVQQKNDAEARLSKFKTAGLTVASGVAIGLICWLGHIALVVQSAKLPVIGN